MHGVSDFALLIRGHWKLKLDGLRVGFLEIIRLGRDGPVTPAVQMLDHADGDRSLLRLRRVMANDSSSHLAVVST